MKVQSVTSNSKPCVTESRRKERRPATQATNEFNLVPAVLISFSYACKI